MDHASSSGADAQPCSRALGDGPPRAAYVADRAARSTWPNGRARCPHRAPSRRAVAWEGSLGTRLRVRPLVLEISFDLVERHLLSPDAPTLALVAAWALQSKYGPRARRTLRRALEITEQLDEPVRSTQVRAILQRLNARLLAHLAELTMNLEQIPQSEAFQKFQRELEARGEARGVARGEAQAILAVLDARGLVVAPDARNRILDCADTAQLEAWVRKAVSAKTVDDLFR